MIGAGLIGVASAWFLRRAGHDVTVIDRQTGPAQEASFANGALLTPSMPEPWNSPGVWRVLLTSLGRSDAPMQLRWRALPGLMRWGASFLCHSSRAAFERSTLSNLRLALHSLEIMKTLRLETRIEYGFAARGTLRIFRDQKGFDAACMAARQWTTNGLNFRPLSAAEAIALEPALAPIRSELSGAVHYPSDELGNAHRFCKALADLGSQQGVEFRFRTEITSFEMRSGRIVAALSGNERLVGDHYVVAAGSYSTPLLRDVGIRLPVQPVKGYSVTFEDLREEASLRTPVLDDFFHAAVVPIDGFLRVAGTAEFAGYDPTIRSERVHNLMRLLHRVLPDRHFDLSTAKAWCGLRPMPPDGVPIIGPTSVPNASVNSGHGPLGWTLAAGSAQLLVDLMDGRSPSVDPASYSLKRFAWAL